MEEAFYPSAGRLSPTEIRRLFQGRKTGAGLSVKPSTVNRTEPGFQEWRDAIFLWCGIEPPDLPHHFDRCSVIISTSHALTYKKGSIVMSFHNELLDKVGDLASQAYRPTHVQNDPLINTGRVVWSGKDLQAKSNPPNNPPGMVVEL